MSTILGGASTDPVGWSTATMDDLQQRILNRVAEQQIATGKPVSLTAIRAAIMPPPMAEQIREDVDAALVKLSQRFVDRHIDKGHIDAGGVVGFTVTLDGWLASSHQQQAEQVVEDLLRVYRKRVQAGKGTSSRSLG